MYRERAIFKRGSTTFFISSLFFPPEVKKDVFELYSFVRVADDYVDQVPADKDSFYNLRRIWSEAAANPKFDTGKKDNDTIDEAVVKNMLRVSRKNNFNTRWIESFLDAMQSDITHRPCRTIDATLNYVYGSAEVVGLMMASIMDLNTETATTAKMQGRAFQFINFIRDIREDNDLGRSYFPAEDLKQFNLADLSRDTAIKQTDDFTKFIHFQLDRYETWQQEAAAGYKYIPKRLRIPVQTAADIYKWTAREIRANPLIIYEKKVKPSKARIIRQLALNII